MKVGHSAFYASRKENAERMIKEVFPSPDEWDGMMKHVHGFILDLSDYHSVLCAYHEVTSRVLVRLEVPSLEYYEALRKLVAGVFLELTQHISLLSMCEPVAKYSRQLHPYFTPGSLVVEFDFQDYQNNLSPPPPEEEEEEQKE